MNPYASNFLGKLSEEQFRKISKSKILINEAEYLRAEGLKNISKETGVRSINKITVLTNKSITRVAAVHNDGIFEPLVDLGNGRFEGFAFYEEGNQKLNLYTLTEIYQVEMKESYVEEHDTRIIIENFAYDADEAEDLFNKTTFMGHRGSGPSRIEDGYVENTESAFRSAFEKGASWIELDVQLTKDGVPIIFHNFYIEKEGKRISITSLTYSEFEEIYESTHNIKNRKETRILKLQEVLEIFDASVGIDIEIKYPLFCETCELENYTYSDPLNYVQKIIKNINLDGRKVIFSSFNPQILFALKYLNLKKQLYFLLHSTGQTIETHHCNSLLNAIIFAKSLNISGIIVFDEHLDETSEDLITLVQSLDLKIMAYGDMMNDIAKVNRLVSHGINGIITDNLEYFVDYFVDKSDN